MLNFVEPRVAVHYFVLVWVSFTGVLQIVSARYPLSGLSLVLPRRQPWLGMVLGSAMVVGVFVWFVAATPEMLRPGPAGFEIGLLFSTASLLALIICRLTAALLGKRWTIKSLP
jgi:hypothetical protein